MKKCIFTLTAIFILALVSCEASDSDIVITRQRTEKVKSIQEIIDSIPKYESRYKEKSKKGTSVAYIPNVLYKGSFEIQRDEWEKLSKALKGAGTRIRVALDFSACTVEAASKEKKLSNGYGYLPYHTFYEIDSITEIRLPEGLSSYATNFEECDNLRAVFFPKNTVVTSIEGFKNNHSLEEVHIYKFDGWIGGGCFERCGVEIPDSEFNGQRKMKLVEFPENPINLRGSCFSDTEVEKFIIPGKSYTVEEWVAWCKSFDPKTGLIKEITASSELDSASGKYSVKNLANAHWTSWVEGSEGDGSGESVTITLEEPTTIQYICIKNGFGNLAYYWANNRPKEIKIILDDDEKNPQKYTFSDTPFAQYINLNMYDKLYSKIKIVIESVYKGTDSANDCAIDEIAVNAGISRRQIYGAYYDSDAVPYLYSPEVQKILKALYTLDVGSENVRVSKDGFVDVKTSGEDGESYWTRPSGAFSGTLYRGFSPGTGGGHSYNLFHIYLNPNGEHYLFTWHDQSYGVFELYPSNLKIYAWKNQSWKEQTATNHSSSLDEIFKALSFIEKRDLSYDFGIREEDYYSDVGITVYPKGGAICLSVPLKFEYDSEKGVFLPYKKTAGTELSFGTVDSLKALGDWKADFDKNGSHNSYDRPVQIFCYPACFNPDPKMVKFLSESGFKVVNEEKNDSEGRGPHNFSVLESWQAGKNNEEVRAALIEAGAAYSPKMLETAFKNHNLSALSELLPLVKKEERNVLLGLMGDYYRREVEDRKQPVEKTVDYIKNVLVLMQKTDSDISGTFWNSGLKLNLTLVEDAFHMMDMGSYRYVSPIPLLDLYQSLGLKIPEQITTWWSRGKNGNSTPISAMANLWIKNLFTEDSEIDQNEKSLKLRQRKELEVLLDYLLKHGVSINARSKTGENVLHAFCTNTNEKDFAAIRFFVEKGADVNIKNERGETPLAMLLNDREGSDGTQAAIEFLKAHGAKSE